ncbi:hypothetical protein K474DRAFT_1109201 [Panus rudis PR-1116 ss-1]|nr:hypothetical protein K474DRAFT_1109201 [Panus rudis PR-1116 ss-1]
MASASQSLKSSFRTFLQQWKSYKPSLAKQGAPSVKNLTPFYEAKLPWFSRFTWTLVALDLAMTASAFELTLSHWTQLEELPAEESTSSSSENAEEKKPQRYVMRPLWQRLPVATGQLVVGVAIATLLVASRSRTVKKIFVIPTPSASSSASSQSHSIAQLPRSKLSLIIQTAKHFKSQGRFVPLSKCSLETSKDPMEVGLKVEGINGPFWIGLEGAKVDQGILADLGGSVGGKKEKGEVEVTDTVKVEGKEEEKKDDTKKSEKERTPAWYVREAIYTAVYGKEGRKMMARAQWDHGPVSAH